MTPSPEPEKAVPVVAARLRARLQKEADRRNSAYDYYGMDNTPQTVDADLFALLEMIRLTDHEAAMAALRAEVERLRGLLRRSVAQLDKWQRKYGERNPAWLPPAGDVRLAEDIDAAITAAHGAQGDSND